MPDDIRYYHEYGGEKVFFTKQEISSQKTLGMEPGIFSSTEQTDVLGLTLLGFQPRSFLKVYHNVKHSVFLFPDDSVR
jgi:hypothetical protein